MTVQSPETPSPETPDRSPLAELLVASDRDPVQLLERIREVREATAVPELARDLDDIELRFLSEEAAAPRADAARRLFICRGRGGE